MDLPDYRGCRRARVLVADPPWRHSDSLGQRGGAAKYKNTLSVDEIKAFPLPPMEDNCLLFLWRVAQMQREAFEVIDAWGFEQRSEIVWAKLTAAEPCDECGRATPAFGMGRYVRNGHEICLIARRGRNITANHSIRSVLRTAAQHNHAFEAPVGEHSEKPPQFYSLVRTLTGHRGPYVELFARRRRRGWRCYGNELGARRAA